MQVFVGIDWGATYIKAGLVDSQGKIIERRVYSSEKLKKKQVFLKNLESLVKSFRRFKIKGVGIGAPGIIDIKRGSIYYLPNIPGWKNYPLKSILGRKLKLPVFIDNDANIFALAESRLGVAKGKLRGIFFTLGTGLGGAVILEGKVLHGKASAAELGHIPISLKGELCGCGARGCIETFVGSNYLLKRYKQLKRSEIKVKEVEEIFKRGLQGEREALVIWREFSQSLGRFLAGMVNVFNPEVIVLGGGLSGAFKLFKPLVWQIIKRDTMWPHLKDLKLVKARLKDAGIIGAGLLAKESLS